MVILAWCIVIVMTIIVGVALELAERRKITIDILSAKLRGEQTQTRLLTNHVDMLDAENRRIHRMWLEAVRERDGVRQASPVQIFGTLFEN